jgi:hypothetical protein
MTKLFLLKAGFTDRNKDNNNNRYYCPNCAELEGVLTYYPELREKIEIHRVDFERPRKTIIEIIGEENQSCPVLIIDKYEANDTDTSYFTSYGNQLFVNSTDLICRFLAEKYKIGNRH